MLTLIANNQDFSLGDGTLKVNMGKLHANQAYRPLLLGTDKGIVTYENDAAATEKLNTPMLKETCLSVEMKSRGIELLI